MNIPHWLLRLLPRWEYICPKCRKTVKRNSHKCPYCGEKYPLTLRVPPSFLKDPKKLEAYVHKHVFPRISKFERNYLTQYFTVIFSDGFETGDLSNWNAGMGLPVAQNVIFKFGSWALSASCSDMYNYVIKDFGVSYPTIFLRAYVSFSGFPAVGEFSSILDISENAVWGNFLFYVAPINVAGTTYFAFSYRDGAGVPAPVINTVPLSLNTWYCVEVGAVVQVLGSYTVWINGNIEFTVSNIDNTLFEASGVIIGNNYTSSNYVGNVYIDNLVIADGYIGPEIGVQLTLTNDMVFLT